MEVKQIKLKRRWQNESEVKNKNEARLEVRIIKKIIAKQAFILVRSPIIKIINMYLKCSLCRVTA